MGVFLKHTSTGFTVPSHPAKKDRRVSTHRSENQTEAGAPLLLLGRHRREHIRALGGAVAGQILAGHTNGLDGAGIEDLLG